MDAQEAHELEEQHEHAAHGPSLRPVSFTISVLAVAVAIVTVMGHRSHTEAVLFQNKATDDWNLYQAHKIRQYDTQLISDLLATLPSATRPPPIRSPTATKATCRSGTTTSPRPRTPPKKIRQKCVNAERRADRFDLGEALLEIGLVITSVTLLDAPARLLVPRHRLRNRRYCRRRLGFVPRVL